MELSLDIGMIRGLGTLVVMIAFIGLSLWVFNRRRDRDFAEARLLPFVDDRLPPAGQEPAMRNNR
ncbi:Cbb3-type cytochrome oxidase, subunit 3 [Pseudomonas putida]|jgi:cytochrome c oxidase cbb3-type subunit 4|uniref:Cbb3-type cytochrome oxidase component FixQ n=1 Tax=Pseudomonas putida TaxID=303 RepID=A0A1B2F8C7_PSEPU|nr:Cbb3-type cytochrome oxidase component FixQ [Pseudomonas putida]SDD67710.1 cytochrome c oxidase cbb3-type subunit 4 [Pseudomonas guariconensis]CAB5531343.1 Cbb3-type cytochrome oxidase, subunit 3 [Pseudomonas putida]CAB5536726.1 Cbb3-type cytochrome oxidase, subunit 3 [Pseudomonas putida]CAB5592388.1 Cbb3-type cytochrome oxidase, subunit 3 [Pseudomonas putida]